MQLIIQKILGIIMLLLLTALVVVNGVRSLFMSLLDEPDEETYGCPPTNSANDSLQSPLVFSLSFNWS